MLQRTAHVQPESLVHMKFYQQLQVLILFGISTPQAGPTEQLMLKYYPTAHNWSRHIDKELLTEQNDAGATQKIPEKIF